ncbi:MAG: MGMT family protein [Anaerolineales bacterium]
MRYLSPAQMALFQNQVWDVVRQIPAGKVATYGQISHLVSPPAGVSLDSFLIFGARWVGSALAKCPDDVPWQRVINAKGTISLRESAELQRFLLESEGICFDQNQKIDLKRFGWEG